MHDAQSDTMSLDARPAGSEAVQALMRFWRLAQRRTTLIGWVLAVHVAAGLAYYAAVPRSYRSNAKLMIIEQTPDKVATVNEQSGSDTIMATHRELVRSPIVVGGAIERLKAEHRVDLASEPPDEWVAELTDRLSASAVRKTNVLQVGYNSGDPEAAAAVVNAVIGSYLEFVDRNHGATATDILTKLTSERDEKRGELARERQALQVLRQSIGHLAVDNAEGIVDPTISRAIRLNEALIQTQKQRIENQASLTTVKRAIANGEDVRQYMSLVEETVGRELLLSTLGMSEQDQQTLGEQHARLLELQSELRRVSPHLGPQHPRVRGLAEEVRQVQAFLTGYNAGGAFGSGGGSGPQLAPLVEQMLVQAVAQLAQRERQLAGSFDAARREAARHSGALVELSMRERDVMRLEREVDVLFEKIAAVDIHQVQGPIKVTPVEEPLPDDEPVFPQLRIVFPLSLLMGIAVSLGLVYAQDMLDDRFGSPEEIALQLELPVLAMVRQFEPQVGEGLAAVPMHTDGTSTEMEAFRTLRTALTLNTDVADRIAVSSAEPSDGKTTITSNLAVAFAQVGKRTLVIDADLRRPGMTALMGLKGVAGMTDVLTTEGDITEVAERVVVGTEEPRLDVIPAGPRRPNAPELLSGSNFAELLAWADANYDQVLVDCPPVLAVSDAQLVGRMVDGVLVVLSPEKNHRRLITRACDSFRTAGVRVLGVVANRISKDPGKAYGYGYAYNYGEENDGSPAATPKLGLGEDRGQAGDGAARRAA